MLFSWLNLNFLESIVNNLSLGSDGRDRKHGSCGLGEDRAWTTEWGFVIATTHKELGLGAALGVEDTIAHVLGRRVVDCRMTRTKDLLLALVLEVEGLFALVLIGNRSGNQGSATDSSCSSDCRT
jgi:hypothetical protein